MECSDQIKVGQEIKCKISLSAIQDQIGNSQKAFTRFDLDGGKFKGQIEIIC